MRPENHTIEQNITYQLDNSGDRSIHITDVENKNHYARPINFYINEYLLPQDPNGVRKITDSLTINIDQKDLKCFIALLDNIEALADFRAVAKQYLALITEETKG